MKNKNDNFPGCIGEIESVIGYVFRDKSLLTQAFTRTSFCNEAKQRGEALQSNEVLEFVGDSVLSVAIITFLMQTHAERCAHGIHTQLNEGDFSNIKSKLSDKKNLSECIKALGLEKHLRLGEGDKKLGIESEPSVMEDLFESIIGAVYLDSERDISVIMRVVSRMLDVSLYAVKNPPMQSTKNALQEFCADKRRRLPAPIYKTLGEEGPDHKKIYERGVYIGERLVASAKGKNLKLADTAAAEIALGILVKEEKVAAEKVEAEKAKAAEPTESKKKKAEPMKKAEPKPKAKSTAQKKPEAEGTEQSKTPAAKNAAQKKTAAKSPDAKRSTAKVDAQEKQSTKNSANSGKKQTNVSKAAEPTVKPIIVKTVKNATQGGTSAAAKLKTHATKSKVATPTFKDLGESREGAKTVYRVECIFMGKSAVGTGATRPEAKENAADKILGTLTPKKPAAKPVKKAKKGKKI